LRKLRAALAQALLDNWHRNPGRLRQNKLGPVCLAALLAELLERVFLQERVQLLRLQKFSQSSRKPGSAEFL
jgi:hypothetical protein